MQKDAVRLIPALTDAGDQPGIFQFPQSGLDCPLAPIKIIRHLLDRIDYIDDYALFESDPIYRNATALCILQIGELVGKLTDDFREEHPSVPWRQIKAMRNIVAHSYGSVVPETTWEIITGDIPDLKRYCQAILEDNA